MDIDVGQRSGWTVVTLAGDLTLEGGTSVYLRFQRELLHGRAQFLFDLDGVGVVDTEGLGVLVRCYRDARSRGGEVCLYRVPDPIERILEFTRLDTIFRIAADDLPPVDGPTSEAA